MRLFMRSILISSAVTTTLFVRLSETSVASSLASAPSPARDFSSVLSISTTSVATPYFSLMISVFLTADWSMRAMISCIRLMFARISEIMMALLGAYAAMCACWGTNGRSTGINFAADTFSRRITCVTYSSLITEVPEITSTGADRAFLFGMTRTTAPLLTAV